MNPSQAAFVHALTTPKGPGPGGEGATLIGVGDDWQAIFGFQGGDASLIRTTADPAGVVQTLCEPITLVNGYRFGQGLADASRAVVTMDPKARDRRIRGLGPEPVGGVAAGVGHRGEAHAGPHGRPRADGDANDGGRAGRLRALDTGARGENRRGGGRARHRALVTSSPGRGARQLARRRPCFPELQVELSGARRVAVAAAAVGEGSGGNRRRDSACVPRCATTSRCRRPRTPGVSAIAPTKTVRLWLGG